MSISKVPKQNVTQEGIVCYARICLRSGTPPTVMGDWLIMRPRCAYCARTFARLTAAGSMALFDRGAATGVRPPFE